jgi:hypothetical protein
MAGGLRRRLGLENQGKKDFQRSAFPSLNPLILQSAQCSFYSGFRPLSFSLYPSAFRLDPRSSSLRLYFDLSTPFIDSRRRRYSPAYGR